MLMHSDQVRQSAMEGCAGASSTASAPSTATPVARTAAPVRTVVKSEFGFEEVGRARARTRTAHRSDLGAG